MIEIIALCPSVLDGTSWYRGAGVLNAMKKQFKDVNVTYPKSVGWSDMTGADIFFLQRPYREEHLACGRLAKSCGLKIWVDYDDLLTGITPDNPSFNTYASCEKRILSCLEIADVITVSTPELAIAYGELSQKNCHVIPNAWNDIVFPFMETPKKEEEGVTKILWRGSDTHVRDLHEVKDQIVSLSKEHPDWEWTFIGFHPWFFDGMPKFEFVQAMDVITYLDSLRRNKFDVIIVPLSDTPFNRCKSNIAWIEGTQAGAVCVAPDFPVWQRNGVVNYSPSLPFEKQVGMAVEASRSGDNLERSIYTIRNALALSDVNRLRRKIVGGVL